MYQLHKIFVEIAEAAYRASVFWKPGKSIWKRSGLESVFERSIWKLHYVSKILERDDFKNFCQ